MIKLIFGENSWVPVPHHLELSNNEVHIWRVSLQLPAHQLNSLKQRLSDDEIVKVKKFYFKKDQDYYIAARGMLRRILSLYTKIKPDKLLFRYNKFGKPFLTQKVNRSNLQFNLSHSNGMAIYAFTKGRDIGVDIEYIRPEVIQNSNIDHYFSTREASQLRSLPGELQVKAFFNCWTRKEAYIKARGEGLSIPLDQFDVSLVPGEPVCILNTQWDSEGSSQWRLREINIGPEYTGTLAVKGYDWFLKCWEWADNDNKEETDS